MVKKIFFGILLLFAFIQSNKSYGQYTLTAYAPVGNNVALEHLWHFTIAGQADPGLVEFYVGMRVFDAENDLIIKSNSSVFSMPILPVYINHSDLSLLAPITSVLYDNFYNDVVYSGGYFPPGSYHVVITLYGRPLDGFRICY